MTKITLTVQQLEKILNEAKNADTYEDMISFEVRGSRLLVKQKDWAQESSRTLLNKPY